MMRLKHIYITLILCLLSASLVDAAEPIKIGVSLGLTGRHSAISGLQEKSFRLWEKDVK